MANSAYGEIVISAVSGDDVIPSSKIVFTCTRSPVQFLPRFLIPLGYTVLPVPSGATYLIMNGFSSFQDFYIMGSINDAGFYISGDPFLFPVSDLEEIAIYRVGHDAFRTVDLYFF